MSSKISQSTLVRMFRAVQLSPLSIVRLGSLTTELSNGPRCELDSHAAMCVVGETTALRIYDFGNPVSVHGYLPDVGSREMCNTVSAVVAYDHPETGEVYMLVIHQAVFIPAMQHNLLCPMQLRVNGVRVNDEPKHMAQSPTQYHHALVADVDGSENSERLVIPLRLFGYISYFPVRKPTVAEYERTPTSRIVPLTYMEPDWDPLADRFGADEDAMLDRNGNLIAQPSRPKSASMIASFHVSLDEFQQEFELAQALGRGIASVSATRFDHSISAATLARRWNISLDNAEKTLQATTSRAVRLLTQPHLSRRFRTNDRQLRYFRFGCHMFTDTLFAAVPSWHRRNTCGQVFATDFGWVRFYPMQKKSQAHEALSLMARRIGIPIGLVFDNAKEQLKGLFRKKCRDMGIERRPIESYSPWMNGAEDAIRELKRGSSRKMMRSGAPLKLWDHCLELEALIRSHTALSHYELQGRVPETHLRGQTGDISAICEHAWYDWIKWWDEKASFPHPREVYGRWLGPAPDTTPAMTAKILQPNGHVIERSTYRALTSSEIESDMEASKRKDFDESIHRVIGKPMTLDQLKKLHKDDPSAITPDYEAYADSESPAMEPASDEPEVTPAFNDEFVGAEVELPYGGNLVTGRVKRRAQDEDGRLRGTANTNPILDTRIYDVEFPDGSVAPFAANIIAENMISQCDPDGNQFLLVDAIVDHQKLSSALGQDDAYVEHNGRKHLRKSTVGWKLCVQWKDGTTSWARLADMKESYPVQVAEYALSCGLDSEPAFAWWVHHYLRKRDRIVAAVNKRYHKRTHKYGIEIPKTVRRAMEIDRENGNTLWHDAIMKELNAVKKAFMPIDPSDPDPVGYQYMEGHVVFDIKLDGFKRKARYVAGGHMIDTPPVLTYASVVSRETVRIALTMAALNDLEVFTGDIQNAYLTAPLTSERVWTILGEEFAAIGMAGMRVKVVRALYGLKSAGASFRKHLADCMRHLGYKQCKADPDLWMRPEKRPEDGFLYYAYVLLYVDDVLCINHKAETELYKLNRYFKMKDDSIGEPDIYLGAKLRRTVLDNGVECWGLSAAKYVKEAVANVERYIDANMDGRKLPKKASAPWPSNYVSELDDTPVLGPKLANYYQSCIGVLHWAVELGRVDMITEVSTLASHMAMPRQGHLDAVLHVFGYLKCRHNARLVLNPTYPEVNEADFMVHDWKEFYGDIKEAIPDDAPEPRGKEVIIRMNVDSDHASDKLRRRSRTGFFVFVNNALVIWHSKKQPTVETSVFGAEFVALKNGMETLRGLRYKIRMMGIPLNTPSYIRGDNMSVVNNTQRPESTLQKKSNSICYHFCRESVAMGESLVAHIPSKENCADLATKLIPGGGTRQHLVSKLLWDIYDYE